ncbi:MAG: T9SS type A sorting domain-containing protein, partial [Flavobacteriales bacterium]|nr:T9SS type A sorting domain-containing protein [Flavobacteriales bacterium]
VYPVGNALTYRPALITLNDVSTCGSLTGELTSSGPGDNGLPLNDGYYTVGNAFTEGFWSLTASGLVSADYDLDLVATGFTSYPILAQTRLLKRVNAASGWATANWGTHVNTSGDTIMRTTVSDISDFDFGVGDTSGCSGLPATTIISGFDSVCTDDAGVSYIVDNHPPNLYFWSVSGGTQVSGGTSNSITVDWGSTGLVGSVSVIEQDECSNRTAVSLPVSIHILPTSAISGNTLVPLSAPDEPYSVTANTGYTYTWITLQGLGAIDLGQGTNSITIDWGGVAGVDTVRVIASMGCGSDTSLLPVTLRGQVISIATGNWDGTSSNYQGFATWDCDCVPLSTDNVIVDVGHVVTLVSSSTVNNLTIRSTGILSNAAYIMTVTGNYAVDGTHSGSGPINLTGIGTTIDGTGTISNSDVLRIQTSSKTILAAANLTKSNGNFSIDDGFTVTNNGKVNISSNLTGGGSSNWVNAGGSTLKVAGALLVSGTLNASANPNRVEYNGVNQTVKAAQYWHLTLSTGGTKTLGGAVDIDGNDTIKAGVNFASANYNIAIAGHWINNGDFTSGTNTVTFDGTTNITGVVDTFNNVVISGTLTGYAGNMYMKGNWTNSGTYTHNSGTVRFTGATTILGSSTTTFNTVIITSTGNLTAHATNMGLDGSFTNDNLFTHNGGTITFSGVSTIFGTTIPTRFNNISVTSIGDLTGHSSNMEVAGNWINDLLYTHNSGRVSFVGTDTISGTATTNFYNVTISGTGTLIGHSTEMRVAGPTMINSGTFTHNSGTVNFNGTTTLAGAGAFNFNHLSISSTLTSAAGGTIGVAGNWSNTGTFNHNSGTVIFNGTTAQTLTAAGGETLFNYQVNTTTPATAVTLNNTLTVLNTVTLTDGHVVTTAANVLVVGATGTVVLNGTPQDSSFIKGPMRHTVNTDALVIKVFPIGKGAKYRAIELEIDQIPATVTEYTAEVIPGDANALGYTFPGTINLVSGVRSFQVDQAPATALTDVKIRIYYEGDDNVTDGPNLAVAKDDGASNWIDLSGTALGVPAGNILSTGFTTFSRFVLANKTTGVNPLPIELLYFQAELDEPNEEVDVSWETASEVNNDYYTLERSTDGIDFEFVTYVEGAGNSNHVLHYSTVDPDPLHGISYYRLKQTDYDGNFTYSDKVVIDNVFENQEVQVNIAVYPNPNQGRFSVQITGKENSEVLVIVMDMLGKEHYSKVVILEQGDYLLGIDLEGRLAPGVYMVVGSSNNKLYSKKLVIR